MQTSTSLKYEPSLELLLIQTLNPKRKPGRVQTLLPSWAVFETSSVTSLPLYLRFQWDLEPFGTLRSFKALRFEPETVSMDSFLRKIIWAVFETSSVHPTPYTPHPTPHTPHPTPYTLHPTPHTLHPTPCTPHPTPYTLHPTPYTLNPSHPTPSSAISLLLRPNTKHQHSTPKHQTPNTKHQTPNTKHQTPNTKHQPPNTKHQTPNTNPKTPNPKHQTVRDLLGFGEGRGACAGPSSVADAGCGLMVYDSRFTVYGFWFGVCLDSRTTASQ
jgi:hypothetical protein